MMDFLNFYTYALRKVKVKKSENAVSVHLFWLDFLTFDGPVSVSTVVFLSS